MAVDLFGNEIAQKEVKIVTKKIISRNSPSSTLPVIEPKEKKVKEKKVKEEKPKAVKPVKADDGMGSYLGAWHGILMSKLLNGARYHVECSGYHYFEATEDVANIRVDSLIRNGYTNISCLYLTDEINGVKKLIDDKVKMFSQVRVYYEKKKLK